MEHSGACLLGASFMFVCASTCWYYLGRSSGWGVRRGFHCDQEPLSLSPSYLCSPFSDSFLLTWRPLNMVDLYLNERLSHFFLEKSWPQSYAAWANFFLAYAYEHLESINMGFLVLKAFWFAVVVYLQSDIWLCAGYTCRNTIIKRSDIP